MFTSVIAGLGLGLSLIIAIGAQNLFVLRQGIRREHALAVAAVCAVSDAVLIAVGVSGLGLALHAVPWLIDVIRWTGAAFLLGYALLAARRALRPSGDALTVAAPAPVPAVEIAGTDAHDAAERQFVRSRRASAPQVSAPQVSAPQVPAPQVPAPQVSAPQVSAPQMPAAPLRARLAAVLLTCLALTWLNPHVYLDTVFLLGSVASTHGDTRWWFAAGAIAASLVWFFGLALGSRWLGRWLATPRAWRLLDGLIAVIMLALAVSLALPR